MVLLAQLATPIEPQDGQAPNQYVVLTAHGRSARTGKYGGAQTTGSEVRGKEGVKSGSVPRPAFPAPLLAKAQPSKGFAMQGTVPNTPIYRGTVPIAPMLSTLFC